MGSESLEKPQKGAQPHLRLRWEKEIEAGQCTLFDVVAYRGELVPRKARAAKPKQEQQQLAPSLLDYQAPEPVPTPLPAPPPKPPPASGAGVDITAPYAAAAHACVMYFINHVTQNRFERQYAQAVADRFEGRDTPLPKFTPSQWGEMSGDVALRERRVFNLIEDIWANAKEQYEAELVPE